jgi:hypothetical protein
MGFPMRSWHEHADIFADNVSFRKAKHGLRGGVESLDYADAVNNDDRINSSIHQRGE